MPVKLNEFLQSKFFLRYLTAWLIIGMFGYFIAAKHIPIRQIVLDFYGVKALLGSGGTEGWKPILSRIVIDADTPWLSEVGLFLQINNRKNMDGRLARNLGEICFAVRYSAGELPSEEPSRHNNFCPPEDFARTRLAIDVLNDIGFLQTSLYVKAAYPSYELNALGTKAFEGVREAWLLEGDDKAKRLAFMDVQYPGLQTRLLSARDWYGDQMNSAQQTSNR